MDLSWSSKYYAYHLYKIQPACMGCQFVCTHIFRPLFFLYPIPFSLFFSTNVQLVCEELNSTIYTVPPYDSAPNVFSLFSCAEYTFGCVCHRVEKGVMCPPNHTTGPQIGIQELNGPTFYLLLLHSSVICSVFPYFFAFTAFNALKVRLLLVLSEEILKCNYSL